MNIQEEWDEERLVMVRDILYQAKQIGRLKKLIKYHEKILMEDKRYLKGWDSLNLIELLAMKREEEKMSKDE